MGKHPPPCLLSSPTWASASLHRCAGKSVLSAELLRRNTADGWRAAAWHFCSHDDAAKSEPCALLRSLAGMLCTTVAGYEASLIHVINLDEAFASTDPKVVFEAFLVQPLKHLPAREVLFLLIDALDEIPKEGQKALLRVIATMLEKLPKWLRIFTTSRDEPAIRAELARFGPKELRADEAKQRLDVEVFLRKIARKHIKGQVDAEEIEADVKRRYGIDMGGKLTALQLPMEASRAIYGKVRDRLGKADGFPGLLHLLENRNPDLAQVKDDFRTVFKQAFEAQQKLTSLIADEWVAEPGNTLRHPVKGKAREWVEMADDPGIKDEIRSREKMQKDYAGHANKLKDLARLTLSFTTCKGMLAALESKLAAAGIKILTLKNKYASPTPMGYSDFNLCVGVQLDDGTEYVCEMQLNLVEMLEAKNEAHVHYEKVRTKLPALCEGTKVDPGELEAFIVGRLSTSALDSAVESLSQKADGLFLYAFLLAEHLDAEAAAGQSVDFASLDSLPAGLGEVYATNFKRAFPAGTADPMWCAALPLIEVIVAAQEPLAEPIVRELLGLGDDAYAHVLDCTALLFPVRDGRFHVFHKTIVDWLTGDVGGSITEASKEYAVDRAAGHKRLASSFKVWLTWGGENDYFLKHGLFHLCRAGEAAAAAQVYASNLALLQKRVEGKLLDVHAKDYVELKRDTSKLTRSELVSATAMKRFSGKYQDVLEREGGAAVLQLALQQPDASIIFKSLTSTAGLAWRNKPQQEDPCIATFAHPSAVNAVAVSPKLIVSGSGNTVYVRDAESEELLDKLDGSSEVKAVAVSAAFVVAGYKDGTLKVWDSGVTAAPIALPCPKLTPPAFLRSHAGSQD